MSVRETLLKRHALVFARSEPARTAPAGLTGLVEMLRRLLQLQPLGTDLTNPFLPLGAGRGGDAPCSTLRWVQPAAGTARR